MSNKTTEWKRIKLSNESIDFSGATSSEMETDGDSFISLALRLRSGRLIRIRKSDYATILEEPSIPMVTKYLAKTSSGLQSVFNSKAEADQAVYGIEDAEVIEQLIPERIRINRTPILVSPSGERSAAAAWTDT